MNETRLEELERLAARVEVEIRQEKRRIASLRPDKRPPGRPRGDHGHGTERDYQHENHMHRERGGPPPCEVCTAAHALHQKRKNREQITMMRLERTS